MNCSSLGRSGLKVSRLCLGTWNFGSLTDERAAYRIMDTAIDMGINFFDTANHYPDFVNCGRTEEIIGRWFAFGDGRREKVILATKVYQPMNDLLDGPNGEPGLSLFKIRRHLEGSLRRLNTDHVDLYQMHHIDRNANWMEIWEAFESLVRNGKICYVGSSNFAGWHLAVGQAAAEKRGFMGLVSEQHRYSLMCRLPELEVLPSAQFHGVGVLAYNALHGGSLGGNTAKALPGTRTSQMESVIMANRAKLNEYTALCQSIGESEANIALAWVMARKGVASLILGPRTEDQLKKSEQSLNVRFTEDSLNMLDQIFPGPGGEAPEAYSW